MLLNILKNFLVLILIESFIDSWILSLESWFLNLESWFLKLETWNLILDSWIVLDSILKSFSWAFCHHLCYHQTTLNQSWFIIMNQSWFMTQSWFNHVACFYITQPPSRLFIAKNGLWNNGNLPWRANASSWSKLARTCELVPSPLSNLGAQVSQRLAWASQRLAWVSQGPKNSLKWPFCHFLLVSFALLIKTLNDQLFHTVTDIQHRKSTSKDQKINKRYSPNKIRVWQVLVVFYD